MVADRRPEQRGWSCPLPATQVDDILQSACGRGVHRLILYTSTGQLQAQAALELSSPLKVERGGTPPSTMPSGSVLGDVEASAPVVVQGETVAVVHAVGPATQRILVETRALMTATRLADAWRASQEIDSLAGEVVHAYEELSLLYELGETLSGQVTVTHVANLILEKILQTLPAEWAELSLADSATPIHVRPGHQSEATGTRRSRREQRLSAPLRSGGETIGTIALVRAHGAEPFSSADAKLLDAVSNFAGSAIRNAQLYQELRRQADTDALTGLTNHRAIQERLDAELAAAAAEGHTLGIVMIDIDDFKLFNDTYGHLVGDQILRMASEVLREACRDETDVVGRYGGDEFLVLLPRTSQSGVNQVAQRILTSMAQRGVRLAGQDTLPLALSIGCALFPEDAVLKHDLLSHADAALYETKRHGGNGVHFAGEARDCEYVTLSTNTTFGALQGLVNAVDAKDRYTREHSQVVTEGALLLARHLNLSTESCDALRIAGLLHDVGKIGIPDYILRKPGKLTDDEYKIMQQHVALSELIIKEVPHLIDVLSAVACHHERYDGRGYPRGLKGDEIPLMGRIMALADACSAMVLSRPYRKGMNWAEVAAELRRGSGTQFDPTLVEPFIKAVESTSSLGAQHRVDEHT